MPLYWTRVQYMEHRMMTEQEWQHALQLARRSGLDDAQLAGLAIGCPRHGNAGMDWDDDGVFCHPCDVAVTAASKA